MTLGGWFFMLGAWALIVCLSGYTLWKTLSIRRAHLTAPLEIEEEDLGTEEP